MRRYILFILLSIILYGCTILPNRKFEDIGLLVINSEYHLKNGIEDHSLQRTFFFQCKDQNGFDIEFEINKKNGINSLLLKPGKYVITKLVSEPITELKNKGGKVLTKDVLIPFDIYQGKITLLEYYFLLEMYYDNVGKIRKPFSLETLTNDQISSIKESISNDGNFKTWEGFVGDTKKRSASIGYSTSEESYHLDHGVTIAVINFVVDKIIDIDNRILLIQTQENIIKKGKYKVVDRENISYMIEEKELELSGFLEVESIKDIGSILNAQYLVIGKLLKLSDKFIIAIQIVEVQTARIIIAESEIFNNLDNTSEMIKTIVNKIM